MTIYNYSNDILSCYKAIMNFKRPLFKKKPLDVEVKGNVRNNEILGIK